MKNIPNKVKCFFTKLRNNSDGQALIIVALSLVALIGFGALTTDIGYLFVQRRNAQNVADAAALAGTWVIQDGESEVNRVAEEYAKKHNIAEDEISASIINNKFVKVEVEKEHELFLARIININSSRVGAKATATRSSIWKSGFRDLLPVGLTKYKNYFYEEITVIGKNGKETTELQLSEDVRIYLEAKYPSKDNVEALFKTDLSVYKEVLEYFINNKPEKIFDIVTGNSSYGSFGFLDLDGANNGGASEVGNWIDNGYNSNLINIISENGNMATLDTNLRNYIKNRGNEAYIIGILPNAIDKKPNNWKALPGEYVIIHVRDLELIGSGGSAKLIGNISEVFYPDSILLPGQYNEELLPQSWLID